MDAKKVALLALSAIGGYALLIKVQRDRQDQAVWEEVTDPISTN